MDQILTDISMVVSFFIVYLSHLSWIQWVQIFVAILGIQKICQTLWLAIIVTRGKLDKKFSFLRKEKYFSFFTKKNGRIKFRVVGLRFHRNWKNELVVMASDLNDKLKYKGLIKFEGNQPLMLLETERIDFNGDVINETVQVRFSSLEQLNEKIVYCLWMGRDLDGSAVCGVRILSDEKLPEHEVKKMIKENMTSNNGFGMMSFKFSTSLKISSSCFPTIHLPQTLYY